MVEGASFAPLHHEYYPNVARIDITHYSSETKNHDKMSEFFDMTSFWLLFGQGKLFFLLPPASCLLMLITYV